ncbi:MAG: NCS2 family permease [Gammaproteobacteria bacterium]|nr:NCS2 family permease [Gammaproteobacteria bacterium]
MLETLFKLNSHGTTVKQEIIAGITTWVTMVYIVAVIPVMLTDAGMNFGAVFVATCLATAFSCLIMGAFANLPIALAPGIGLSAFFVYSIVLGLGYTWNQALGAVFWSGILFLIFSLTGIRERIIYIIPDSIKTGIAIGIGLFLAVIGLDNAGIITQGEGTLMQLGNIKSWSVALTALGFFIIVALHSKGKNWSVIFGISLITAIGWLFDPDSPVATSVIQVPPSMMPTFFQLDFFPSFEMSFLVVIITMFFVDLFDTSGTLVAVAKEGNLEDANGKLPGLGRAMLADSSATVMGSLFGVSSTTSYIESTAGVAAGGKTGLTSIVVAALFLGTLFFSPIASSIPTYATSPALIFVAVLLISAFMHFDAWNDFTESAPLIVCAIMMPLSFSIADGLALGIISYVAIKLLTGKRSQLHPILVGLAVIFIGRFVFI